MLQNINLGICIDNPSVRLISLIQAQMAPDNISEIYIWIESPGDLREGEKVSITEFRLYQWANALLNIDEMFNKIFL